MSETAREHKMIAPQQLKFALITVSTSRYSKKMQGEIFTDVSADIASDLLTKAGHVVTVKELVSDDTQMLHDTLKRIFTNVDVEVVITLGGTGITPTDITIEAVASLYEKELLGFGEIFRRLSYDDIGSAAILTRCTAGLIEGKAVFCIPGSPQAVHIALVELIIPESGHILAHARG